MKTVQPIDVVCALIVENGKVLIVQHGPGSKHPGKWEFPGGKVHAGEMPEEALVREIREELGVGVNILLPLEPVDFSYPEMQIRLIPFVCQLMELSLGLAEHCGMEWVRPEELERYDLLPADRELMNTGDNYANLAMLLSENNQRLVWENQCWRVKKCWDI